MIKVVTLENMRQADDETIKNGITEIELIERAAKAIFSSYNFTEKTAIVCGKGNNGGDGYALAVLMKEKNISCSVFMVEPPGTDASKYFYNKLIKLCIPIERLTSSFALKNYNVIVDCLLGTGFKDKPNEEYSNAISLINCSGAYVISVDINSGINGNNGLGDIYVKSDLTVCLGAAKAGIFLGRSKDFVKDITIGNLGIKTQDERIFVAQDTDFHNYLLKRMVNVNKGTFGSSVIIGGCENYIGAVKLSCLALAALRSGCGLSRLVVGENIFECLAKNIIESTLFKIGVDNDGFMAFDEEKIKIAMQSASACSVGMGWGKGKDRLKILNFIFKNYRIPVVVDADGLNACAEDKTIFNDKKAQVVITPHPGEMSRLTGKTIAEILNSPVKTAQEFSDKYGVITVLKGASTVVTDGTTTYIVPKGCPGMATAGSGDVLSGILCGVLAQRYDDLLLSVAYATYLNGFAGELAENEISDISLVATDTISFISKAIKKLRTRNGID